MTTLAEKETRRIRRMMRGRLGTEISGPDGTIYGFWNDQHVVEDVEGGTRMERQRSIEVPTADLGTIAKGTVLTIDGAEWKVWSWPPMRLPLDGLVAVLVLTENRS